MAFTDYVSSGLANGPTLDSPSQQPGTDNYWDLGKLKKTYQSYIGSKTDEIDEQKQARRYYHGAHWTAEEIKTLKARKQPVVTFNRIGRKIDGVVGLLERLRQDPKAFPRTPKHEEGADLATAVLRYVLDEENWKAKSPEVARDGAIDGVGGLEITIEDNGQNDREVRFDIVEPDSFFYDPRSYRMDFSDARFMGVGKWLDLDTAKAMFPDSADQIQEGTDLSLTTNPDRELKWYMSDGAGKNVRIVDEWYKHKGEWCYCIYTGSTKLMEGRSFLLDEKGKPECKYIMFSANIDHDGDRYGFVRNMKSANDEINHRRSKGLFQISSKRLILTQAAVQDVEVARREWSRPDGVVVVNGGNVNEAAKADDQTFDFMGQLKLLENAYSEIENFGPNPALIGQGIENKSGRAIALLQQAGVAELGPYILAYRGWKLRVYRAIWNAIRRNWTAERWIRVTDSEDLAQFVQVNGVGIDPQTGMPALVNAIGQLDVDIIIDEGPDAVNMAADTYDALLALAQSGAQVPPAVLIELAPGIDSQTKKKVLGMIEQAQQAPAVQLQAAGMQAKVEQTQADAKLKGAQTLKTLMEAHAGPQQTAQEPAGFELPPELQIGKAAADINAANAKAEHVRAQADKTRQETALNPIEFAHDVYSAEADRQVAKQPF